MDKKQFMQALFALSAAVLLTTGCSNDELTSPNGDSESDDITTVTFNLGLPAGDEVNYTRADVPISDDATEWAIKTLKVYHFSTTTTGNPTADNYTLVKAYDVPVNTADVGVKAASGTCVDYGTGDYNLRISLRSGAVGDGNRHKFVVVANDVCSSFDTSIESATDLSTITLSALKQCIADKQLTAETNSANLLMGTVGGLCMTGETGDLTLIRGHNDLTTTAIALTRIMARLDVKSYVSASKVFVLKSVTLKYSGNGLAPKGYLFSEGTDNIWYDPARTGMNITQNTKYNTLGFPDYDSYKDDEAWVGQCQQTVTDGSNSTLRYGTWYKKVIYMYPYPATFNGRPLATPALQVSYTLNGVAGTKEVSLINPATTKPFDMKRNYVYTLQVGDPNADSQELSFSFVVSPWNLHQIDADLNEGETVL